MTIFLYDSTKLVVSVVAGAIAGVLVSKDASVSKDIIVILTSRKSILKLNFQLLKYQMSEYKTVSLPPKLQNRSSRLEIDAYDYLTNAFEAAFPGMFISISTSPSLHLFFNPEGIDIDLLNDIIDEAVRSW